MRIPWSLRPPPAEARQRLLKAITREKKVVSIDTAAIPATPVQPIIETVYVDAPQNGRSPLACCPGPGGRSLPEWPSQRDASPCRTPSWIARGQRSA